VVTKDGRTVVLKQNGTWEFKVQKPIEEVKNVGSPTSVNWNLNLLRVFDRKSPFDDFDATSIPDEFSGHSTSEIVSILSRRFAPKDEFETTAAYTTRVTTAKSQPIYEKLPLDATLVTVPEYTYSVVSYDADKSRITIELPILSNLGPENVSFANVPSKIEIAFDLAAVDAKELKQDLKALFLFRLKEPYLKERSFRGKGLVADLLEIWFFNGKSGKVEYKLKNWKPV
jgi:hypothetical protein